MIVMALLHDVELQHNQQGLQCHQIQLQRSCGSSCLVVGSIGVKHRSMNT